MLGFESLFLVFYANSLIGVVLNLCVHLYVLVTWHKRFVLVEL